MTSFKEMFARFKLGWYLANLWLAKSAHSTTHIASFMTSIIATMGMLLSIASGSWGLALTCFVYQGILGFIVPKTSQITRNMKNDLEARKVQNAQNPDGISAPAQVSWSLATLAVWLKKFLQLGIAVKLFMNSYQSLRSAVKEGAATSNRVSDFGKAVMWFVCIPLMIFFDFDVIINSLRVPLTYIGLYDSVSRVFSSANHRDLEERKVAVQEESNKLAREKLDVEKQRLSEQSYLAHKKAEEQTHANNAVTSRDFASSRKTDLETLKTLDELLRSNEPVIVAEAYRHLYRRENPELHDDEIEALVNKRMRTSSIYMAPAKNNRLGKTLDTLDLIASEKSNTNKTEMSEKDAAGVRVEKQAGWKEKVENVVNFVGDSPKIAFVIGATILGLVGLLIVSLFKRQSETKRKREADLLLDQEAAAGKIIKPDDKTTEWWANYKEDCMLLYGQIPEIPPGAEFTTEDKYLLTLATTINKNQTDRDRLGELCNYKSEHQIKVLRELLAKHRQPRIHSPTTSEPEPVVESKKEAAKKSESAQSKEFACTCGKAFSSARGRYNHRKKVGCAVQEGKKAKTSKGKNIGKAATERGGAGKKKLSKADKAKRKLDRLERERNEKYKEWKELQKSSNWRDQVDADEIREQLEEYRRRAAAYEKDVEAVIADIRASIPDDVKKSVDAPLNNNNKRTLSAAPSANKEGVSVGGAKPDIPHIWVRCVYEDTASGKIAFVGAMPMANKLFLPKHFVDTQLKEVGATNMSMITVTCQNGAPLPSFRVGELKIVEGFDDQVYVDYQAGGLTFVSKDSIGEIAVGDPIVIRKPSGDTHGEVVRLMGDYALNVGTSTTGGDCNSLVYNTRTGKLVGLHNAYYPQSKENAFLILSRLPKKYLLGKVVLGSQPALSEN